MQQKWSAPPPPPVLLPTPPAKKRDFSILLFTDVAGVQWSQLMRGDPVIFRDNYIWKHLMQDYFHVRACMH